VKKAAAVLTLTILVVFLPSHVFSQVFYQYPEAPVVNAGEFVTGPYFAFGENETFRFGGFGRMNATEYFDVGFELLFNTIEGDWSYGAAGDVKFGVLPTTERFPFDLSLTAGLGAITRNDFRLIQFPFGGVISSPFELDRGNTLVPYLGVYLLVVNTKIDVTGGSSVTDTDVDVEARGGLRYTLSAGPDIWGAVHLGRDTQVMVGMSFWLKGRN
jgi:hypothetical protein